MRKQREIFSLSFLDIMSCSFGAILLIILISNFSESNEPDLSLLKEKRNNDIIQKNEMLEEQYIDEINKLLSINNSLKKEISNINALVETNRKVSSNIKNNINKLNEKEKNKPKDQLTSVAGLSVDANYVIFIIDNSGSMQQCGPWNNVIREVEEILDIFPNVKGFNILNDRGTKVLSDNNVWLELNPTNKIRIRNDLKRLASGSGILSGSNPLVGLETAITRYLRKDKISFFLFGDDISGTYRVEAGLKQIENKIDDRDELVSINAVSFMTHEYCQEDEGEDLNYRFMNLMRNLTHNYNGSLIQSKY
jgi:translation initiation factor 2 beta subunit (eIF-2beta)/eIF-5